MTASLSASLREANAPPFCCLAILVERRQRLAIAHGRAVFVLRALLLGSLDEWRAEIEAVAATIGAGELPIDEHRAAGVFAAGRVGVRRDQAIHQRLDRGALRGVEEDPRSFDERRGRRSGFRTPGQPLRTSADRGSADEQERHASKQFAPMKPQAPSSRESSLTLGHFRPRDNEGFDVRRELDPKDGKTRTPSGLSLKLE